MIIISHRANLFGPDPDNENRPEQVVKVLNMGYDVEIDVWLTDQGWFLGHDNPQYKIEQDFLYIDRLWCHAQNLAALQELALMNVVSFWHQEDDFTLTTNNFIWTYPNEPLVYSSICVLPEKSNKDFSKCAGICTDYPIRYKEKSFEI